MLSSEGKEIPNSDTSLIDAKVKHILEDFSRHFVDQRKNLQVAIKQSIRLQKI